MATGKGDLNYAAEKIGSSVHIMATTHGTLQERLYNAWVYQGHHALPMGPGQIGIPMSDELIQRLVDLNERMSSITGEDGTGAYAATVLNFSDEEASEVAEEVYEINYQIRSERAEAKRRS